MKQSLCLVVLVALLAACQPVEQQNAELTNNNTKSSSGKDGLVCPANYLAVPGDPVHGTNDFCVMTFEAKNDGAGKAISQPTGVPWGNISVDDGILGNDVDAFDKCANIQINGFNGNFHLITNQEWMTIAHNVEQVSNNWVNGNIGSYWGFPTGNSDAYPGVALAVLNENDPFDGTSPNPVGPDGEKAVLQRRTLELSNGNMIWDFAGNVNEWIDWSSDQGFDHGPMDESSAYRYPNDAPVGSVLQPIDYQPMGNYGIDRGFGMWWGGTGGATIRGGDANSGSEYGGIYALDFVVQAHLSSDAIGFRCAYTP